MTLNVIEVNANNPIKAAASHGYYRQDNGWLTVSPAAEMDRLHYVDRGWQWLREYGTCEIRDEYTADHPFETLLMYGGASAFPRAQVIENGWNLRPPLIPACLNPLSQSHARHSRACMEDARPAVFPQLLESDYQGYPCRFCENPPYPSDKGRDQHETVMHREEKADIRQGSTTADALIAGLGPYLSALAQAKNASPADDVAAGLAVLEVLQRVGLNKTQLAALEAAGLVQAEEGSSGDS